MVNEISLNNQFDRQKNLLTALYDEKMAEQLIAQLIFDEKNAEFRKEIEIEIKHAQNIGCKEIENYAISILYKARRAKSLEELSELKENFNKALKEYKAENCYKMLQQEAYNRAIKLGNEVDILQNHPVYETTEQPIFQKQSKRRIPFPFSVFKSNTKRTAIDYKV